MLKLNPYLNFMGRTEEAFNFYKSVFGGDFLMIQRFDETPDFPGKEKLTTTDLEKIMHVSLKVGDETLMATDAILSLGHKLVVGNNISLSLTPDTKEEADKLFKALGEGGKIEMPMTDAMWGDYFGMLDDKFGVKWMINVSKKK